MLKRAKRNTPRKLRFIVTFCDDEEKNQEAFERAVRRILELPPYDRKISSRSEALRRSI